MTGIARDLAGPAVPALSTEQAVLDLLPIGVVVFAESGAPLRANRLARVWGVLRDDRISSPRLRRLVRGTLSDRDGEAVEEDGHLPALPGQEWRRPVRARIDLLPGGGAVLSLEDRSAAEDVDAVRRDFMVGLAHELKTPLGALLLLSEAAVAAGDDAETRGALLGRLHGEASRLTSMVRDVLELARVEGREELPLSHALELGAVVDEAIAIVRASARDAEVGIHSVIGPATAVCGNGAQLADAVRRLLDNAVAVTEPGGTVDVELRRHDGWVDVRVSDRGPGVPLNARARVFERFYRVDAARSRRTGGSGVGLAVVKHVAERHSGSAFVRARPGGGATFILRLPLAP